MTKGPFEDIIFGMAMRKTLSCLRGMLFWALAALVALAMVGCKEEESEVEVIVPTGEVWITPPGPDSFSCDDCPMDQPLCKNGKCYCTEGSCYEGMYCDDIECRQCDVDDHCGPECAACSLFGMVCSEEGSSCIACSDEIPCGEGQQCLDGECQQCATDDFCGPECAPCSFTTPKCQEGVCVCAEDSCMPGTWCLDGECSACNADTHCGFECVDCTIDGPLVCVDGECRCTEDGQCSKGHYCDGLKCVACGDSNPEHCGPNCAQCGGSSPVCEGGVCVCSDQDDCGENHWCSEGECLLCSGDDHCGPDCITCQGNEPLCQDDTCVCTPDSCPGGQWCNGEDCQDCGDDDPANCGPMCLNCAGSETPACKEGKCACTDESCGDWLWCNGSDCKPCGETDALHCGVDCLECPGGAQAQCVNGDCLCIGDSCGPGFWCNGDSHCQPCIDALHCGLECVICGYPTPVCDGEECVECLTDEFCAAGHWCQSGMCMACPDNDPLHCGLSCETCSPKQPQCTNGECVCSGNSCGDFYDCVAGSCALCNLDDSCGKDCAPCEGATPHCREDGEACVECANAGQCGVEEKCDEFVCKPDCDALGCATDEGPDGEKCGEAIVVGRPEAEAGVQFKGDTFGDGNNDDQDGGGSDCWDAKYDNFYRIWLVAGDKLEVTLEPTDWDFDAMMKLYKGTSCDGSGDDDLVDCYDDKSDGGVETIVYSVPADGWYTVVVDGRMAFEEDADYGDYKIDFKLTCKYEGCCCW